MFHFPSNNLNFEIEAQLAAHSRVAKRSIRKSAGHVAKDIAGEIQDIISKAGITTSTGITNYSLDLGLMGLYPNEVPFLDLVPRKISHKGDVMTHWKTITNPDQFNVSMGVAEGQRTGSISPVVNVVSRAYATLGKESNYTFEAEEAAEGFDNLPSQDAIQLLSAFRIGESKVSAYGNATNALGTANTPVGTGSTTSGALPAATYVIRVVPLTYEGLQYATIANGVATTITRNNNDGTSTTVAGGSGIASAASAGVTLASAGNIAATVAPTTNAYAYAWYIGTSSANAVLAGFSTLPSFTFTAAATGTQTAASITVDNSVNALIYDGLATQIAAANAGTPTVNLNVGSLTSDGAGGISQFTAAFVYLAETYKLSIDVLVVGYGVKQAILQAVFGSTGPVYRIDTASGSTITAGNDVDELLNPYTGQKIKIVVDPWAPTNFAFGFATRLPYKLPDVPMPFWIETRMRDYYQIDWPVTTRNKYFGIYYSGVMKVPAPFAGVVFGGIVTPSLLVVG
jgi:hypothetical protein